MTYFLFDSNPWLLPITLLVLLTLATELPPRLPKRFTPGTDVGDEVWNVVQGGIIGLVAFVLGLSFSQAEARFDARRLLVVTEANAIGTTWLRADQLPPPQRKRFRDVLTAYTALRLKTYGSTNEAGALRELQTKSNDYQDELWSIASGALRAAPSNLGYSLLMETLNETIDVSSEQSAALINHVPTPIVVWTLLLVLLGATRIGISFARARTNPRVLALAYIISSLIVSCMMVDLDRPQTGFIRINLEPLSAQLASMH